MKCGLSGRSRCLSRWLIAAVAVLPVSPASAAMQMDGDAKALTVVLEDEGRSQVIAALAQRLGFRVVGTVVDDGVVSGRFRGDLIKVLNSVLTQNGFVIVYESGKPSQLLLSAKDPNGASAMPMGGNSLLPNGYNPDAPPDPNAAIYLEGTPENAGGGIFHPDPTEMPVENVPAVEPE